MNFNSIKSERERENMTDSVYQSACTMDCPDTCSLNVHVQDGRITQIKGSHLNPTTQGFICTKISRFTKRVYGKDRVLYPMKRSGEKGSGLFERISWQEAAETICTRLQKIKEESGGEAILPFSYGGSNGLLGQDTTDLAFFAQLGASRLQRTFCAVPTTEAAAAMYGKMPCTAFDDFENAKLIIIWGANPKTSNIHLMPFIKKAKKHGAKVAVVDPRMNFSENECDLHLPVLPGTDVVVALSMINYWRHRKFLNWDFIRQNTNGIDTLLEKAEAFSIEKAAEIARVDATRIQKLADLYALHDPAVIRIGWGMERNRNGLQSVGAALALPAVLGKFGLKGSGYALSSSGAYKTDETYVVAASEWNTRIINMSQLGSALSQKMNPPIKALFNYNCNPAATAPDQNAVLRGLQREDLFTVVSEQVMTDTAKYADILLPAVTFLEQKELKKAYGSYALQYLEAVIEPVGEAKPNEEMFALLGRTMGWQDSVYHLTTDDYVQRIIQATRMNHEQVSLKRIREDKIQLFNFPGETPVQYKTVFPQTSDGKIHLAPAVLGERPYEFIQNGNSKYPLCLISPATDKMISSTLGEFNFGELFVVLNPADAESRSLQHGATVRVFNDLGEVVAPLRLSRKIRPGVAFIPKGVWRKSSHNGFTANALAPQAVSSVGGACFNDALVEVEETR